MLFICEYGFVKSTLGVEVKPSGTLLLLDFRHKVNFKVDFNRL